MPNWCDNKLFVKTTGPKRDMEASMAQLAKFKTKALKHGDQDLVIDNFLAIFYPMPKDIYQGNLGQDERQKYGDKNWYDWSTKHWGTKWDVEAELMHDNPTELRFTFMSAWAPPVAWLEHVAKQYPLLHFALEYYEPGMAFRGLAKGRAKIIDKCYTVGETASFGKD